jgi:hypothetical protein
MDDRDRLARRFEAHRLLVVLDTLTPVERLAFVLQDLFAVPFEEVAAILGRSGAARKLASRARRRVRQAAPGPRRRPGLAAGDGGRLPGRPRTPPTPRPGRPSRLSPATSGVRARPVVTFG